MNRIPIGSNQLGLRNSQQQFGYFLIAGGALVGIASTIRLVTSDNIRDVLMWMVLVVAIPFALRRMYTGACIALSVVIDLVGPASFEKESANLRELLLHRRIWTYERPPGLLGQIYFRFLPHLIFLTPPYRDIVTGAIAHLLFLLAAIACSIYLGSLWVWLVAVILAAAVGRLVALRFALAEHEKGIPPVEVHESRQHLTSAGNPSDLYNHLRVVFEDLREGQFQNRTVGDQPPHVGVNATTNNFQANLTIETQPMPLDVAQRVGPLLTLNAFAVLLEVTGFALFLFRPEIAQGDTMEHVAVCVAGAAAILYGSKFFLIAQRIHFSFRFRSDVIWLNFTGSYVVNKLSVGGGLSGLPSTEGQTVKSDVHVFVRGARLVSECMPIGRTVWDQIVGSARPAEETLQHSPRYLVSSRIDSVFTERLDRITKNTTGYRDSASTLRTPDLADQGMRDMLGASAQINQMLHASAALGSAQGQAAFQSQSQTIPSLPAAGSPQAALPVKSQQSPQPVKPRQPTKPQTPSTGSKPRTIAPPPPPPGPKQRNSIQWRCSNCSHMLSSTRAMIGKQLKCSKCGTFQKVPSS